MNTITTQTVDKLGLLADLNAAKLSGEGWTAAHSDAVGSDRFGKVIFNNGATHELVLPIGLIRKWTRLLNRGLPPYQSACNEIGVEFDKDNRLKLMAGASQITFNNRPLLASGHMPTYILNADDMGHVNWHNGGIVLCRVEINSGGDAGDGGGEVVSATIEKPWGYDVRVTYNNNDPPKTLHTRARSPAAARRWAMLKRNVATAVVGEPYTKEQWVRVWGEGRM